MPTVEDRLRQAASDLRTELAKIQIPDPPIKGRIRIGWMGSVIAALAMLVGFVWLAPFSEVDPQNVAVPTTEQPSGETSVRQQHHRPRHHPRPHHHRQLRPPRRPLKYLYHLRVRSSERRLDGSFCSMTAFRG